VLGRVSIAGAWGFRLFEQHQKRLSVMKLRPISKTKQHQAAEAETSTALGWVFE